MGFLHLEKEPYHRQKIRGALQRRGMKPDFEDDWEIHGPHHPELPYKVYVGLPSLMVTYLTVLWL